jgi:ABC-2 type transport system permease protein
VIALLPEGFLWFLRHDMRIARRRLATIFGGSNRLTIGLMLAVALALIHGFGLAAVREYEEALPADPRHGWTSIGTIFLFVAPWIVAQALTNTTRALYTRGDLDMILSSPMSPRAVFLARAIAVAFESIASIAMLILPIANMMALYLGWRWLAIYPTLLATGFFGTGLGLVLTMALFHICGPRRTRLVGQVVATIVGAGFALGLQIANILPESAMQTIAAYTGHKDASAFDPSAWWWIPVRAATGDLDALIQWSLVSLTLFTVAALSLAELFAHGAISTQGAEEHRATQRADRRFIGGASASLLRKEWRLLTRDPWLASQMLQQIIYTLPVSVVLWKAQGPGASVSLALAPTIVVVAAHISASLAWLTISSEDAPEFLQTAPVPSAAVTRAKLQAIALPLVIIFGPVLVGIFIVLPKAAIMTTIFAALAATSTALLNLWRPAPGKRGDLMRRHQQSKLVGMIEHALSLFWAMALALAAYWSWTFIIPSGMALGLLWLNRPKGGAAQRMALGAA